MARGQIDSVVLDGNGAPVVGAQVQVQQRGSSTLAAIWQGASGATELPNPCFTDVYGRVPGWLNRGAYDFYISHRSIAPYQEAIDIAPGGDGSIDTAWLADGCVTDAKLSGTLSSGSIGAGAVGTTQLADGAVTDAKVNASGISGAKIQAGTLPTAALAASAVTTAKIADANVTDAKIVGMDGSKLVAASVTGAKLANATVTQTQMAADSVGSTQIISGAVGTTEIADGSVTPAKLASSAGVLTGEVKAYAGSGVPAGYVLCDGSTYDGTNPTYAALWGIIGTTYGGTGISAFKVPDLQGREIIGKGTHADVNALGKNDGVTLANRRPKHPHTVTDGTGGWLTNALTGIPLENNPANAHLTAGASSMVSALSVGVAGGAADSEPFLVLNYIIKL